jgi:hypothetical protein
VKLEKHKLTEEEIKNEAQDDLCRKKLKFNTRQIIANEKEKEKEQAIQLAVSYEFFI